MGMTTNSADILAESLQNIVDTTQGLSREQLEEMFAEAISLRSEGKTVMITPRNKNVKFQKDKLIAEGYTIFKDFFRNYLTTA